MTFSAPEATKDDVMVAQKRGGRQPEVQAQKHTANCCGGVRLRGAGGGALDVSAPSSVYAAAAAEESLQV